MDDMKDEVTMDVEVISTLPNPRTGDSVLGYIANLLETPPNNRGEGRDGTLYIFDEAAVMYVHISLLNLPTNLIIEHSGGWHTNTSNYDPNPDMIPHLHIRLSNHHLRERNSYFVLH